MKKLTAIICAVVMLMSVSVAGFAAELDFMGTTITNYDATVEYGMELNKPFAMLEMLNEEAGLDVQYFVEELMKSTITANVVCDMSDDYLAGKMYMSGNVKLPLNLSEDLKLGADVTVHMWIDYDLSSVETAKLLMVIKNPLNGKYMYFDVFDEQLVAEAPEMKSMLVAAFAELDLKKYVDDVAAAAKKNYEKYAQVTTADGYTIVSFTNNSLVDFYVDYYKDVMETDYMKNAMAMEGDAGMATVNPESIAMMLKGLGIFSDTDAFTIKYKTNADGIPTVAEESLHIQFNICEVAAALGAGEADLYPLTKENSDIDIKFVAKATYNKVGDAVVEMPVLTEENSINLIDMMINDTYTDDYYYDEDSYVEIETYQSEKFWDYATGRMERGGRYVDLEEFLGSAMWDEDNLTGTVELLEEAVVITFTSDNFGSVSVIGNLREDSYLLNQTQLWGRRPFIAVDEYNWETYAADKKVYVHIDVLNYILGAQVESMTVYLIDENGTTLTNPEYYFDIVRPNPGYVPVEYDIYEDMPEFLFSDEAASIGIIGGADGPTEVFITEIE